MEHLVAVKHLNEDCELVADDPSRGGLESTVVILMNIQLMEELILDHREELRKEINVSVGCKKTIHKNLKLSKVRAY